MVLNSLVGVFSRDMGIDLGTANTLVYISGKGILIREPSVVAIERESEEILAVGNEAKNMIGKTPGNVIAIRPMRDGVIANFDITEKMLRYFIQRAHSRRTLVRPRIVICVPSGVTEVEKRAVKDAALHAGARKAGLIEEPMAAAMGAGLAVGDPAGNMIVDVGGGTTEVAVISLGGIVTSRSIRIGGDEMDDGIVQYVKRNYNLMIGERTAEKAKIEIGSACPLEEEETMEIRGRDLVSGLPKTLEISSSEVQEALHEPVSSIINAVKISLERTPPELASDIMDQGIMMAGGGAMLRGLARVLSDETDIPVHVAESPLECVVNGTSLVLEDIDKWERVLITPKKIS